MDKLRELLDKGFFPIQLPPSFTTRTFSENYKKFEGRWNAQKDPDTRSEKFSVARSSYYRRVTSIVNPISYFFLTKEIATYWVEIEKHFRKSKISLSKPKLSPTLRAIEISRFSELYEAKVTKSAGYRYALITDITSYFPTIYTHTIPWALHGRDVAKKNRKSSAAYFGNILDERSTKLQDGQTIGLPIGPDSSHIIAEIIGVAIDKDLRKALGYWPRGFRYVDDYCLFFDRREEAEKALAELTKAVSNYELQINPSKTRIVEVRALVEESWKYSIRKLKISDEKRKQRDDIHNYFEVLFSVEGKFRDEALVKYGLKQISSTIIKKSNWDIFEAYLLKCGYSFPNTLQVIANILATYHGYGYELNKEAIERFCHNLIINHSISDHHGEVSWLLIICKELGLNIKRDVVREVEGMSNSVCSLLILDMFNSGQIKTNLLADNLRKYSNAEALEGTSWLLAYEAGRRKWLKNDSTDFIKSHHFFGALLKHKVEFFDPSIKIKPIFKLKESEGDIDLSWLFDSDEHIEYHFDFDDQDEEYFDEAPHSKGEYDEEDYEEDEDEEFDDFSDF
ncbi:RNA-directed DNA polymerase [Pontibacterium granulatum]|uniref:RNA-directed DNA polymerase n=1 Tax=Pontibacterium granulatum TaxID=2036029 RepID=UPI00249CC389|nr:RNA-directed DNA polymerase [Pontibacterium granulatum]MDI3324526.1 RNA-directed DNA polymerase [Pontibacterium granulatum]